MILVQTGVVVDTALIGKKFGSVLVDVTLSSAYYAGNTVVAQFVGANPRVRHQLRERRHHGSYL
jgi:neutral ceramidase